MTLKHRLHAHAKRAWKARDLPKWARLEALAQEAGSMVDVGEWRVV